MIRKLKSGEYRLYSRKADPTTGRRRNLGTLGRGRPQNGMNGPSSSSSGRDESLPVACG